MNLKLIDTAIAESQKNLDEKDRARLDFFRKIWGVQADISEALSIKWQVPEQGQLEELLHSRTPLLSEVPLTINQAEFLAGFKRILEVLIEEGSFDEQIRTDLRGLKPEELIPESEFVRAGRSPVAFLELVLACAKEAGLAEPSARVVALAASLTLKPFLELAAQAAEKSIKKALGQAIRPRVCPVCGSAPSISKVDGETADGRHRSLWCGQCGCEWPYERVRCARCGTQDPLKLHFHHVEGDDSHRIASCDECGGYIRSVFLEERTSFGLFSFEVEDVLMARLDAIAADPSIARGDAAKANNPNAQDGQEITVAAEDEGSAAATTK